MTETANLPNTTKPAATGQTGGGNMLTIELKINGRLVGGAMIRNVSDLADLSDYQAEVVEAASPETGLPTDFRAVLPVTGHRRQQTIWSLVQKVSTMALHARRSGLHDRPPVERGGW